LEKIPFEVPLDIVDAKKHEKLLHGKLEDFVNIESGADTGL